MSYDQHFRLVDDYLAHLDQVLQGTTDSFVRSRYTGMLAVGATTVYELAIKTIFIEFAQKKHKVFGSFVERHFARLNGRIMLKDLSEEHLKRFGGQYGDKFKKKLEDVEQAKLRASAGSVKASYGNIITWRNEFAHEGRVPSNVTYEEAKNAYELGKEVIRCLADAMKR